MRAVVFVFGTCGGLLLSFVGLLLSMTEEGAHGIPTFTYVLAGTLAVAHVIAIVLAARYLSVDKWGKAAGALIAPLPAVLLVLLVWFMVTEPFRT